MSKRKSKGSHHAGTRQPRLPMGIFSQHKLACTDDDLSSLERLKYLYATYISSVPPGREKLSQFEDACARGPLWMVRDIKHWAQEEYFYHGVPGDTWSPMQFYLDYVGNRLSANGRQQLQRWQEARFGFYWVDDVKADLVTLHEWDIQTRKPIGEPFHAVTPGIGGVGFFRGAEGQVVATYVAPWLPERNICCAMGYGTLLQPFDMGLYGLLLNLRRPDLVGTPLPWKMPRAELAYLAEWHKREWGEWLRDRLVFPFTAYVMMPPQEVFEEHVVTGLAAVTADEARQFGVYVTIKKDDTVILAGLSNVVPADIASPNYLPIMEYLEYRRLVGPPPGTRGQPRLTRIR